LLVAHGASYSVRPVYFCASDQCSSSYSAATVNATAQGVQAWYKAKAGAAFTLQPATVVHGIHTAAWYYTTTTYSAADGLTDISPNNLMANVAHELGVNVGTGSTVKTYVVLGFNVPAYCGASYIPGDFSYSSPVHDCAWQPQAVMAHELGHSFGLLHTGGFGMNECSANDPHRDGSLMDCYDACNGNELSASCPLNSAQATQLRSSPWFVAAPANATPVGALISVTAIPGGVHLSGWAADADIPHTALTINIYGGTGSPSTANPSTGTTANVARSDVAAAYPQFGANHGFSVDFMLSPGTHNICAYAHNVPTGTNPQLGCKSMNILPSISGRVYNATTGAGIAGVQIVTCNGNPTETTDANGNWQMYLTRGAAFCVRVTTATLPNGGVGLIGPVTNNNPEHATAGSYEFQYAAEAYYHSTAVGSTSAAYSWDRNVDTGYDFKYTSPVASPAP
jgi:hypothetical protein